MQKKQFEPIDLVIVNFYPFEKTIKGNASKDKIIENIDIGGPSMVRSAAKSSKDVTVITDIEDYSQLIKELNKIKKQGYAFDNEEWFNGMVGLSVPITNNNSLYFCLSTHTAKSRKNIEDLKKILPLMLNAAENLKKILFFKNKN